MLQIVSNVINLEVASSVLWELQTLMEFVLTVKATVKAVKQQIYLFVSHVITDSTLPIQIAFHATIQIAPTAAFLHPFALYARPAITLKTTLVNRVQSKIAKVAISMVNAQNVPQDIL